ncbi:Serine/threonine phosphatase stp [termite gut metagenome]|uniref:Serine/threonine phosphatase stp n=1 Tax=termite gut metagenome TaxID=433724 RepID=A0A5J4S7D1_9ZZZZ
MLPLILTKTDIGKRRETNEDSVASLVWNVQSFKKERSYGVLVVADGMGGLDKGEIASDLATKRFIEEVFKTIYHSSDSSAIEFETILLNAVNAANKEVWEISRKESNMIGTTLVAAIIADKHIYIANVGDSRAYLITPQKSILQITKDHSAVQEMLDAKIITKEQAKKHPRRNIITKALGLTEQVTPDIFRLEINNEILMLCTDGLYGMIEEEEIVKSINGNMFKSADALISLANEQGGIDNISLAIATYGNA